jgi:hypothetical protein
MSPSQLRPQSSRKEADAGKRGRFLRRARVAGGGVGASRRGGGEVVARKEKVVLPCGHGDVEVAREEHLSAWAADRRRRRFAIVRRRRRRQRRWREADEGGFQRRGKPARLSLSY